MLISRSSNLCCSTSGINQLNRLVKDWIIEYLNYLIGLLVFQEMLRTMIKSLESNKILVMPPRKILWLKETKPFRICHDLSGNCSVLKTEFKFFHYFLNLNCEIEKQALVQISVILWLYNWGCPYQRSVMSEEWPCSSWWSILICQSSE